jgi:putative peptide zinc metalloprotease protein
VDRHIDTEIAVKTLPALRPELSISRAEPDADGEACWILVDPIANRHFRLARSQIELLGFLSSVDYADFLSRANQALNYTVTETDVEELINFLRLNNLVVADNQQKAWYKKQVDMLRNTGKFGRLARSPLFIRIPLWNPDKFLDSSITYVKFLASPVSVTIILIAGMLGLLTILQNLDEFTATFLHFFNVEGLALYFLTLVLLKICHELGHAYVAKSLGCRVPMIGVAFIVGWPVLYTDTTDAWKLAERDKKLKIGIAGVAVEMAIACISLFFWNFLDDGPLRSATFLLATTTWVVSLLINFNPLMRFDGYYLLSDWLRIPNLERRSFELSKWKIRELLFGLDRAAPEPVQIKMIVYGISVWIYRFFLFLGIALLVYNFLFKALGLLMFFVEIGYFLIRPIFNEFVVWWKFRDEIKLNKQLKFSLAALLLSSLFLFVPWQGKLTLPAQLVPGYQSVYAPVSARLVSLTVSRGQFVENNADLAKFSSPSIDQELRANQQRIAELTKSNDYIGFDPVLKSQKVIFESRLRTERKKRQSLLKQQVQLNLKSPSAGQVVDVNESLSPGVWVAKGEKLFAVLDPGHHFIRAYVRELDLATLAVGSKARFYPENASFSVMELEVLEISQTAISSMNSLYQTSLFGGDVAVREQSNGELATVFGLYNLKLKIMDETLKPPRVIRGDVVVEVKPLSYMSRLVNWSGNMLNSEPVF